MRWFARLDEASEGRDRLDQHGAEAPTVFTRRVRMTILRWRLPFWRPLHRHSREEPAEVVKNKQADR